jgi:hypothetical protein
MVAVRRDRTLARLGSPRGDDKRERERSARDAIAGHLRRMMALIDGLDAYVRFGMKPGLERT